MSSNPGPGRFERLVAKYKEDHSHPINHVLHVFVGWPMVGAALLLLPLGLWPWSLGLFLGGYAIMFTGHFAFERNTPTILKHPTTPFVIAWDVIRNLGRGVARLAGAR
ncbi:MAG: Mpo1-like protein [Isosphaeraceae bacterium]